MISLSYHVSVKRLLSQQNMITESCDLSYIVSVVEILSWVWADLETSKIGYENNLSFNLLKYEIY